jgi:hypothetical protein
MSRSPGFAGFAAPGPKPGPARQRQSRSPGSAGGDAPTEVPLSAGQVLNPKVRCPACRFPTCPKAAWKPMGASRSMPLSHPPKGKPAASAWRRLRQPPCLRFACFPPGETQSRSARAVAGKAIPRCRKIVSATSGSCHEIRGAPSPIRLWITRITGVNPAPVPPDSMACPSRARRIKEAPINAP